MEKFLLVRRLDAKSAHNKTKENLTKIIPLTEKWIASLSESGKYSSGAALSNNNRCVGRDHVIENYHYHETNEEILGYDIILAENLDEAVSIAKTCPMVSNGIALYEVRPIVALIR
jgi:hypothetical protein